MKKYTNINDIKNVSKIIQEAIQLKAKPLWVFENLGKNIKHLVMLFFNSSLRTSD